MTQIVVLPGDGIGPEITKSALNILRTALEVTGQEGKYNFSEHWIGGAGIDAVSDPCPLETIEACKKADAILLGAIGGPQWEKTEKTPEMGLLQLRQALELYANVRPTKVRDELVHLSPLKEEIVKGTDFVMFRELIGGLYFGKPKYYTDEEAFDTMYYSRKSIERIVRQGFAMAMERRKRLASIDKANVLANSKLWRQIVEEISREYPEVEVEYLYVDAAAMKLIANPTDFDVIVTENLFGDILSDEASMLPGSLGLSPSASYSANGPRLYEPIHGSAPDIAGQDKANPLSMILSVTMMLKESFAEEKLAHWIEDVTFSAIEDGFLPGDLGGTTSTSTLTKEIIDRLKKGESH